MHPLEQRLTEMIRGIPEGGAVTLPREAVVRWLQDAEGGADVAAEGRRLDVADLTVAELAEALDRAESTVRGWLPDVPGSYKLHGEWRVPREAWRAHLDSLADDDSSDPPEVRSRHAADLGSWRDKERRTA